MPLRVDTEVTLPPTPDPIPAAYMQLLSVGLLWISVHCAGMCGPLLIGFDVAGAARKIPAARGALSVLTYQAGRSLTYAILGAIAGLAGAGLGETFNHAGSVFALVFAVFAISSALYSLRPPRPRPTTLERRAAKRSLSERLTDVLRRALLPLASARNTSNLLALGAVMGFLPCMITYWVLGLAATTGSALHGAALMILLVIMTTPTLLGVTLLPRLFVGRLGRFARYLPSALLGLSGSWLALVGLAGFDVIGHVHIPFELFGEPVVIMLW